MAINDPVGDMLTRIRNAQMRRKTQRHARPARGQRARVLDVLQAEGYIRGYTVDRVRQRPERVRDRAEIL